MSSGIQLRRTKTIRKNFRPFPVNTELGNTGTSSASLSPADGARTLPSSGQSTTSYGFQAVEDSATGKSRQKQLPNTTKSQGKAPKSMSTLRCRPECCRLHQLTDSPSGSHLIAQAAGRRNNRTTNKAASTGSRGGGETQPWVRRLR